MMTTTETYEVFAVKYGNRTGTRGGMFIRGDPHDAPMDMDYYVWALRSPARTIVVDVGYGQAEGERLRALRARLAEPLLAMEAVWLNGPALDGARHPGNLNLSFEGIDGEGLRPSEMQTANGKVQARIASQPAVWLGQSRIENVRAAFLEDQMLGNSGLLGMSVLSRFTLTIDDKGNRLTLDAKGGGQGGAPAGAGPVAPPPGGEGQTSAGQGAEPAPEMAAPPLPGEAQPPVLPEGMQ